MSHAIGHESLPASLAQVPKDRAASPAGPVREHIVHRRAADGHAPVSFSSPTWLKPHGLDGGGAR